jgi:membrane protease YdiL (CAAX protease family)
MNLEKYKKTIIEEQQKRIWHIIFISCFLQILFYNLLKTLKFPIPTTLSIIPVIIIYYKNRSNIKKYFPKNNKIKIGISIHIFIFLFSFFYILTINYLFYIAKYLPSFGFQSITNFFDSKLDLFITTVIIAPICEEIIFRGMMLNYFLKKIEKKWLAIIFNSIIFTILHLNIQASVPLFIMSIFFCYIYLKTQNIFYPIGFHIILNLIANTEINNIIISDYFIFKNNPLLLVFLIFSAAIFLFYIRKNSKKLSLK